jgi:hypothetical protein
MKQLALVIMLCAMALGILTPIAIGVNANSVNSDAVWADGGGPPPPFPAVWADGGGPPPPFRTAAIA